MEDLGHHEGPGLIGKMNFAVIALSLYPDDFLRGILVIVLLCRFLQWVHKSVLIVLLIIAPQAIRGECSYRLLLSHRFKTDKKRTRA